MSSITSIRDTLFSQVVSCTAQRDIAINILSHLWLRDLPNTSLISRQFYIIIFGSNHDELWKRIFARCFPETYQNSQDIKKYQQLCYHKIIEHKKMSSKGNPIATSPHGAHIPTCSFLPLPNHRILMRHSNLTVIFNHKNISIEPKDISFPGTTHSDHTDTEGSLLHLVSRRDQVGNLLQTYDVDDNWRPVHGSIPISFDSSQDLTCIKIRSSRAVGGLMTGAIHVWDCKTGRILKTIQEPLENCCTLHIDMDDRYIVADLCESPSLLTKRIRIWDHNGTFLEDLLPNDPMTPMDPYVQSIRIQRDRLFVHTFLRVPEEAHELGIWSLKNFEKLYRIKSRAFDVNDDYLITLQDTKVVIWDLSTATLKMLQIIQSSNEVFQISLHDGFLCVVAQHYIAFMNFSADPKEAPPLPQAIPTLM
jgi:WD40 repeat protein